MFIPSLILIFALVLRLLTLVISKKNEKILLAKGSVEHGVTNSKYFTIFWIVVYSYFIITSLVAAFSTNGQATDFFAMFDVTTVSIAFSSLSGIKTIIGQTTLGLAILIFAYATLLYVIIKLGELYTVKLFKSPNQIVLRGFLFGVIKHPIYFLVLLPEVFGLGIVANSTYATLLFLVVAAYFIIVRLKEERKVILAIKLEELERSGLSTEEASQKLKEEANK